MVPNLPIAEKRGFESHQLGGNSGQLFGLRTECQCRYRPWPYVEHSPLRELTNRIAQETFGYMLREEVCPGGLEIGYFFTHADFDAVMLGPNMKHRCS